MFYRNKLKSKAEKNPVIFHPQRIQRHSKQYNLVSSLIEVNLCLGDTRWNTRTNYTFQSGNMINHSANKGLVCSHRPNSVVKTAHFWKRKLWFKGSHSVTVKYTAVFRVLIPQLLTASQRHWPCHPFPKMFLHF